MSYATSAQLLLWYGARELVQTATPDDLPLVAGELLRLTILAEDRTGYSNEELAAVDGALERLTAALVDASSLMDAYLMRRYALPLAEGQVTGGGLPRRCGAIARFLLQDDRASAEVKAGYQEALAWMTLVSDGKVALAGESLGAGGAEFAAPARVFDHATLKDFL